MDNIFIIYHFNVLWYLFAALSLFILWWGVFGIIYNHRDLISILLHAEISMAGVFFFTCLTYLDTNNPACLIFALIILTVAACETAIGLSLVVAFYRLKGEIKLEEITLVLPEGKK